MELSGCCAKTANKSPCSSRAATINLSHSRTNARSYSCASDSSRQTVASRSRRSSASDAAREKSKSSGSSSSSNFVVPPPDADAAVSRSLSDATDGVSDDRSVAAAGGVASVGAESSAAASLAASSAGRDGESAMVRAAALSTRLRSWIGSRHIIGAATTTDDAQYNSRCHQPECLPTIRGVGPALVRPHTDNHYALRSATTHHDTAAV